MTGTIRTTINGKLCEFEAGSTAGDVIEDIGRPGSRLVALKHDRAEELPADAPVESGGKYRSVAPIIQGAPDIRRLRVEASIVERENPGTRVVVGTLEIPDTGPVIAARIDGVRISAARLRGNRCHLLFVIPRNYPATPPIGVYLNRNIFRFGGRHYIGRALHGAPELISAGWRWYCTAIGSFDSDADWRPAVRPEDGDNLATVVAATRVSLERDDE